MYQALTPPCSSSFTPISGGGGGGAWAIVPLSYASDSGAARICPLGSKLGSEATEQGEGLGGGFPAPTVRSFFFLKYVYEYGIFL